MEGHLGLQFPALCPLSKNVGAEVPEYYHRPASILVAVGYKTEKSCEMNFASETYGLAITEAVRVLNRNDH